MSDANLLREAATKVRETALALGDCRGPWYVLNRDQSPYPQSIGNIGVPYAVASTHTSPTSPPAIADHIALWHPGVALAVADWLEQHAAEHDARECEREVCAALKTARALLGEDPR
ncbi:hypothetical protein ACIRPH_30960 [Nocardiopsis sp. NPDC101807]|uniref:hypothetical protein n=1 Tax=Nocardiopsis sp. NPDC101807 TaxID=3364339 RepID=UPI0037FD8DCE